MSLTVAVTLESTLEDALRGQVPLALGPWGRLARCLVRGEIPRGLPDELLEPLTPGWAAVLLCTLRALGDWMDLAPAALAPRVEQRRRQGWDHLETLLAWADRPLFLEPWLQLERARWQAFAGDEEACLATVAKLLRLPRAARQTLVLERALEFLRSLDEPHFDIERLPQVGTAARLSEWMRWKTMLAEVPLTRVSSLEELRASAVDLCVRTLSPHQAMWLQREAPSSPWRVRVYRGPAGYANFSQTVLAAWEEDPGLRLFRPERKSASESLILTEARCVMVCPVTSDGLFYISHQEFGRDFQPNDQDLLLFLSRLVEVQIENLQADQELAATSFHVSQNLELLKSLPDSLDLGLIWADSQGRITDWNPASAAFVEAELRAGQSLGELWTDQGLVDFIGGALLKPGLHRATFRRDGPQWWEAQLEVAASPGEVLLTLQDVTWARRQDAAMFLEEERHWRAGELHDGPLQMLCFQLLEDPDNPRIRHTRQELRELLEFMRSPALEGVPGKAAFQKLCDNLLPEVEWEVSATEWSWTTATGLLYRAFQALLDQLTELPVPEQLTCSLTPPCQATLHPLENIADLTRARQLLGLLNGSVEYDPALPGYRLEIR